MSPNIDTEESECVKDDGFVVTTLSTSLTLSLPSGGDQVASVGPVSGAGPGLRSPQMSATLLATLCDGGLG